MVQSVLQVKLDADAAAERALRDGQDVPRGSAPLSLPGAVIEWLLQKHGTLRKAKTELSILVMSVGPYMRPGSHPRIFRFARLLGLAGGNPSAANLDFYTRLLRAGPFFVQK